jgi:hypothetical protein
MALNIDSAHNRRYGATGSSSSGWVGGHLGGQTRLVHPLAQPSRNLRHNRNLNQLAVSGERFFLGPSSAVKNLSVHATSRFAQSQQQQYSSNRAFLQFTGKAKIHAPRVRSRLDYSQVSSIHRSGQQRQNRNALPIKASRLHSSVQGAAKLPGASSYVGVSGGNNFWSKSTLQRGSTLHKKTNRVSASHIARVGRQQRMMVPQGANSAGQLASAGSTVHGAKHSIWSNVTPMQGSHAQTINGPPRRQLQAAPKTVADVLGMNTGIKKINEPLRTSQTLKRPVESMFMSAKPAPIRDVQEPSDTRVQAYDKIKFPNSAPSLSSGPVLGDKDEVLKPLDLQGFVRPNEVQEQNRPNNLDPRNSALASSCDTEEYESLAGAVREGSGASETDSANDSDTASEERIVPGKERQDETGDSEVGLGSGESSTGSSEEEGDADNETDERPTSSSNSTVSSTCAEDDGSGIDTSPAVKAESTTKQKLKKGKQKKKKKIKKKNRSSSCLSSTAGSKPGKRELSSFGLKSSSKTLRARGSKPRTAPSRKVQGIPAKLVCTPREAAPKQKKKRLDTGLGDLKSKGFEVKYFVKSDDSNALEEQIKAETEQARRERRERQALDTGLNKLKADGYVIKISNKESSEDDAETKSTPRKDFDVVKQMQKAQKRVKERKKQEAKEKKDKVSQGEKAASYVRETANKQKELRRARIYAINAIQREWRMAMMAAFAHNRQLMDQEDLEAEEVTCLSPTKFSEENVGEKEVSAE